MKLFENSVERPTNEIKKKRRIFIVSIVAIVLATITTAGFLLQNISVLNLEGAANDSDSVERQQKAVLEVAKAYMSRGKQLQYDSYRKNLNITPEDSTSKHTTYTVCSGLVYMSYKQALNMELPANVDGLLEKKDAKLKGKTIKAKFIYPKDGVSSREEFQRFMKSDDKLSTVKPGDILVWTNHVMLVEKVDLKKNIIHVIHATGVGAKDKDKADGDSGRYDTENQKELIEEDGAVHRKKITVNNIKKTNDIAIIRYIYGENKITAAASTRLKYPEIDIAKIIMNVEDQSFTTPGSELTYQIRIRNEGKKTYKNVNVKENINSKFVELKGINLNTKYVDASTKKALSSGNGANVKQIKWSIPEIKPGKYVTLQYTVKVKEYIPMGTIITSTGKVGNISTSKIETLVNKSLTAKQVKTLKDCFENYKSCFKEYEKNNSGKKLTINSGRTFVNTLYKVSLGIDIDISNIENLSKLFSYDKTNKKIVLNNSIKKYLYSNFYGLRIKDYKITEKQKNSIIALFDSKDSTVRAHSVWGDKVSSELEERARTINSSMLKDGDVILTYTDLKTAVKEKEKVTKTYIYLDKTLHRYKKENNKVSFEKIKGDKLEEFLNNLVGDNYIILRPYVIEKN